MDWGRLKNGSIPGPSGPSPAIPNRPNADSNVYSPSAPGASGVPRRNTLMRSFPPYSET